MHGAVKEMQQLLTRLEILKTDLRTAARKFVESYQRSADDPLASLGHWVGMATHDVGPHEGPLRAGHGVHD